MTRAALALVVVASAWPARADNSTAFDAQQFHPSLTSGSYLTVDSAFAPHQLGWSTALFVNYAHDPLVLRQGDAIAPHGRVLERQLTLELVGSLVPVERLEIGLGLPVTPYQLTDNTLTGTPALRSAGVGELRIEMKGFIEQARFTAGDLGFAFVVGATFPTGDAQSFLGEHTPTGHFRLVTEWRSRFLRASVQLGFVLRPAHDFNDMRVGSQLAWGAAVFAPFVAGFGVLGELRGLVEVDLADGQRFSAVEAPTELELGLRWASKFGLTLSAAAGVALDRGYGEPDQARVIFGVRYERPGRLARKKAPPLSPAPSQVAALPPKKTAPPPPPPPPPPPVPVAPPVKDRDNDGVPDEADRCVDEPGPKENQGCPDFDTDLDGIVDRLDKCPFEAETFNGVDDDDGCPDKPAPLAALAGDQLILYEPIRFENESALVDAKATRLLEVVAHIMNLHAEILKWRIEGHVDDRLPALEGLELSRARAAAVRRWLIDHGKVDPKRLRAQGFGADRPIADNHTFVGRSRNRRIEIAVTQRLQ